MNTRERIKILQDTIDTHRQVLKKIESRYKEFLLSMPLDNSDKGFYIGIVLADFFERYYTCLETIFLRISQYFENQLEPNRWHRNLLSDTISTSIMTGTNLSSCKKSLTN